MATHDQDPMRDPLAYLQRLQELLGERPQVNFYERPIDEALLAELDALMAAEPERPLAEILAEAADWPDARPDAESKRLMAALSKHSEPAALRKLEAFIAAKPDSHPLHEFAHLACYQARLAVEGDLMDMLMGMLGSPLGGKGGKMRYFAVALGDEADVSAEQAAYAKACFEEACAAHDAEVEVFEHHGRGLIFGFLAGIGEAYADPPMQQVMAQCPFLNPNYSITNAFRPDAAYVDEMLGKMLDWKARQARKKR